MDIPAAGPLLLCRSVLMEWKVQIPTFLSLSSNGKQEMSVPGKFASNYPFAAPSLNTAVLCGDTQRGHDPILFPIDE